jgi:hypothetical protein
MKKTRRPPGSAKSSWATQVDSSGLQYAVYAQFCDSTLGLSHREIGLRIYAVWLV